MVFLKKETGRV